MGVENFKKNHMLLEKGKKAQYQILLFESEHKFESNIRYKDFVYIISLGNLISTDYGKTKVIFYNSKNTQGISEETTLDQHIKTLKKIESINKKFYLMLIKVVDLDQREDKSQPKKDFSFIDPDIEGTISPFDIAKDILNIISLFFSKYFFPLANLIIPIDFNPSDMIPLYKWIEDEKLNQNFKIFTQLRQEQFYLVEKSLSQYNLSNKISWDNLDLALSMLVSSIETFSQKYQWAEMKFENLYFGKELVKIFDTQDSIEKSVKENLIQDIKKLYMKNFYRVKGNFIAFCINLLIGTPIYNELTDKLFKNIFDYRSKFFHTGMKRGGTNRKDHWQFTLLNNSKNDLQKFKHNNGSWYVRVIRIPSFNSLKVIFSQMISRFVQYLYSNRENKDDENLYNGKLYKRTSKGKILKDEKGNPIIKEKIGDFAERNKIKINIRVPKQMGTVVFGNEYHREIDSIDLDMFRQNLEKIIKANKEEKYIEAIKLADKQIESYHFNSKFFITRQIIYQKIFSLSRLQKFDESSKLFETYEIKEISIESCHPFNIKAYNYAYQEDFDKALILIDEIIQTLSQIKPILKEELIILQANSLDSKGEILQMMKDFSNAIDYYEKSLKLGEFPFHEKTKARLKECQKIINEASMEK